MVTDEMVDRAANKLEELGWELADDPVLTEEVRQMLEAALAAAPEPQPEPVLLCTCPSCRSQIWRHPDGAIRPTSAKESGPTEPSPDPDEVLKQLAVVIDQCEKVDWLQGVWYNLARDAAAVIRMYESVVTDYVYDVGNLVHQAEVLEEENERLLGELEAAEQHVTILRFQAGEGE